MNARSNVLYFAFSFLFPWVNAAAKCGDENGIPYVILKDSWIRCCTLWQCSAREQKKQRRGIQFSFSFLFPWMNAGSNVLYFAFSFLFPWLNAAPKCGDENGIPYVILKYSWIRCCTLWQCSAREQKETEKRYWVFLFIFVSVDERWLECAEEYWILMVS